MTPSLKREIGLFSGWIFFIFLIGIATGATTLLLFIGLLLYLLFHLYNINRLTKWLTKPSKTTPESFGVWDEIYYQLFHLYQRQRKARRKLTSILTRFQKSTQALPYATIVLNESNEIEWFNPASKQIFGLRTGFDVGQRIDNLIRKPEFTKYLHEKKFDKPLVFELNQTKVLLNINPYGSGQYLVSAQDVTLRSQLDDMRRNFISNASHELRTPLTVMTGYLEVLQDTCRDDAAKIPLEKIQEQSERMKNIIAELIELAKLETSDPTDHEIEIDIKQLMVDVYNEAVNIDDGKHKIDYSIDSSDELVNLRGNYQDLRSAFSNLIINAMRYTPEGGKIEFFIKQNETVTSIGVRDSGIGISYEHIPRLTERFYRVDEGRSRAQGGTGLGLAIVKHILDRHGAVLHIQSQIGAGSTFRCDFPRL